MMGELINRGTLPVKHLGACCGRSIASRFSSVDRATEPSR
jgi:hypothetical protein